MTQGTELWKRYCRYHWADRALGFGLDISRVRFDEEFFDGMETDMSKALEAMKELEGGAIANKDEDRMVGHYWLRASELAPEEDITSDIKDTLGEIKEFADDIHRGVILGEKGPFRNLLHIGIGGSALGPQFVAHALGDADDKLQVYFLDNTDPDGIDSVLETLGTSLGQTLVTVVSKSGSTPEPRNGMLEVQNAYKRAGLDFSRHAVAITMEGSVLHRVANDEGWLKQFPMWDWVGGRTSVMSAVGLVPAALQGIDIDGFLQGAGAMDHLTRAKDMRQNPAALLALMWHKLGNGRGDKDMVILPYKDRLLLFSRYLQQLIMESLGKEENRNEKKVYQGIAVYGNKGSTDQHAYVQQLREGVPNFFVTFIQVLQDRQGSSIEVEPGTTSGDYLCGFMLGTRHALQENERDSISITMNSITPASIGALIALYDRTVGLYAELVDINAYHQPGVEAGKKAAADVLMLQSKIVARLKETGKAETAPEIATAIGFPEAVEDVYKILEHLAANERGIMMSPAPSPDEAIFRAK